MSVVHPLGTMNVSTKLPLLIFQYIKPCHYILVKSLFSYLRTLSVLLIYIESNTHATVFNRGYKCFSFLRTAGKKTGNRYLCRLQNISQLFNVTHATLGMSLFWLW